MKYVICVHKSDTWRAKAIRIIKNINYLELKKLV